VGFAIVGLTGGIGSGKSTVAGFFSELGIPVVDADRVAREVVEPGTDGLAEVVAFFGDEVLEQDGTLGRAKLAARVFADREARKKLESILHPRIAARSMQALVARASEGHPYAIYEAALLVENRSQHMLGALVVVSVDEATQRARVRARDGLDDEAVSARIDSQLPLAEKVRVADYVIENNGSPDATRRRGAEAETDAARRARRRDADDVRGEATDPATTRPVAAGGERRGAG